MELKTSLGYQLNMVARKMKHKLDRQLKPYHLTTTQWAVIKVLSENENFTQADTATALQCDRATCGTVIDKLIDKGMLTKTLGAKDKRCYVVSLTASCKELVAAITKEADQCNNEATKGITTKELAVFYQVLQTINHNLGDE